LKKLLESHEGRPQFPMASTQTSDQEEDSP